jgi:lincosamide nucleotidyltransferase A/C/D/E
MMDVGDLLEVLGMLGGANVRVWLDGGWGVDALLGEQTRDHGDLDIVVEHEHVAAVQGLLEERGFRRLTEGDRPWNFVMRYDDGRQVDVHTIRFDDQGNGLYGPDGLAYPAASLRGSGRIGDQPVRCLTAEYQVESHTGYEIDADDVHDVLALHQRFDVPLPAPYARHLGMP